MSEINLESASRLGFTELVSNKHIYECQFDRPELQLLKRYGQSSFEIIFKTYYDDVVFDGFTTIEQVDDLIKALYPNKQ